MDTAQWPQEIVMKPMEEIISCSSSTKGSNSSLNNNNRISNKANTRPQTEQALNCPRCHSINTKFCYYNNYSLTQPRYFCKTCRRYWTEGGTLRNIPVGGGSRKNKRSLPSSSTSSQSSKRLVTDPPNSHQNLKDLNLAASHGGFKAIADLVRVSGYDAGGTEKDRTLPPPPPPPPSHLSALELLTSGGLNSFLTMPVSDPNPSLFSSGFSLLPELKPSISFSLDGQLGTVGYGDDHDQQQQENTNNHTAGRALFTSEDLKQVTTTTGITDDRNSYHTTGYWNGVLGGGGSWRWRRIHCIDHLS